MLSRRHFVAASLASALPVSTIVHAQAQIQQLNGAVYINHRRADANSVIKPGDQLVVGHDGELEFVLGEDAFRLGPQTSLTLAAGGATGISALRLLTGALLGVFGRRRQRLPIETAYATIGIRGTAAYVAVSPHDLYTCTCYGTTDLVAGGQRDVITATHHNAHTVARHGDGTATMKASSVQGHDDDGLRRLENYLGRVPAFDRT